MIVMKIGGAVLKSPDGFFRMASIINDTQKPAVVVISALAKTTRWLADAARAAEGLNPDEYKSALGRIIDFHSGLALNIFANERLAECLAFYDDTYNEILSYLDSIHITKELTPRTLDIILSFGEHLALKTIGLFLQGKVVRALALDAKEIIVTDNQFGRAKPISTATKKKINAKLIPILKENKVVLIPGFIARSIDGEITTMGMESSNLTAALLAELLGVDTLSIWTDVEGFMSADPRIVPDAVHLRGMTYRQAMKAANSGLKLFHPEMIDHAMTKNITLIYRSAIKPNGKRSIINDKIPAETPVLILKEDICFSRIQSISPVDSASVIRLIEEAPGVSLLAVDRTLDSLSYIYSDCHSESSIENVIIPDTANPEQFRNCSLITVMNINLGLSLKLLPEISECFDNSGKEIFITSGVEKNTFKLLLPKEIGRDVLKKLHEIIYPE